MPRKRIGKNISKSRYNYFAVNTITMEYNMANNNNKPGLLAKANFHSRNALGAVGRPVAVAVGAGFGAAAIGQKFDVGFLQDGYNCAAVGIGTAAAVEGAFYLWGDDTDLRTAQAVNVSAKAIQTQQDLVERLKAAGASESDIQAVQMAQFGYAQAAAAVINKKRKQPEQPEQQQQQQQPEGNAQTA